MTQSETSSGRSHRGALRLVLRSTSGIESFGFFSIFTFGRGGLSRFSSVKKVWTIETDSAQDLATLSGHLSDVVKVVNAERRDFHIRVEVACSFLPPFAYTNNVIGCAGVASRYATPSVDLTVWDLWSTLKEVQGSCCVQVQKKLRMGA
jgi:hypothetical protein